MVKILIKKKPHSNEDKTLLEKPVSATGKIAPASSYGSTPHNVFIDKISIIVNIATGEDPSAIHANIWSQFEDKETFKDAKKAGEFQISKRIVISDLADARKWPHFEYHHADHLGRRFRLEFSPVDLGAHGLDEFHSVLTSVMPNGLALCDQAWPCDDD